MNKINIDSTLQRFKKEDHRVGKLGRPCGEGLLLVAELDVDRHKSEEGEEKHQIAQLGLRRRVRRRFEQAMTMI